MPENALANASGDAPTNPTENPDSDARKTEVVAAVTATEKLNEDPKKAEIGAAEPLSKKTNSNDKEDETAAAVTPSQELDGNAKRTEIVAAAPPSKKANGSVKQTKAVDAVDVTVSGKVTLPDGKTKPGVLVYLTDAGHKVLTSVTTDDNGKYQVTGTPGIWQLFAVIDEFSSMTQFDAKTDKTNADISLKQSLHVKVSGTVCWQNNHERVKGAVVKPKPRASSSLYATSLSGQPLHAWTDDQGNFTFDGDHRLLPGEWDFPVLHESARPGESVKQLIVADTPSIKLELSREADAANPILGRQLFFGLAGGFLLLVIVYVLLHLGFPATSSTEAQTMTKLVEQTRSQIDAQIAAKQPLSTSAALSASAVGVQTSWQIISNATRVLDSTEKRLIEGAASRLDQAVRNNWADQALASIDILQRSTDRLAQGWWWTQAPGRYLEVLLWALAGVLISLLSTTSYDLYTDKFFERQITQRLVLLVAMPLITLIFIFLLSQVSLVVALANSAEVRLDLSDPLILSAVSCIMGFAGWPLFRRMQQIAGVITGSSSLPGQQQTGKSGAAAKQIVE